MPAAERVDLVLAGGGLANGLIAWRLRALRPQLDVRVVEAGPTLGGNHTWSFHDEDLTPEQRRWMEPFVVHRWDEHHVKFPDRERTIAGAYASTTSARFHQVLQLALGADKVWLDTPLAEVAPQHVRCADGRELRADAVIDGRGFDADRHLTLRHQKFLGLELVLDEPHGLRAPLLMDARVPQLDGYRFVYSLPLDERRVLVEDTYFADGQRLDTDVLRERALAYARDCGWRVQHVAREEHGVLPMALGGDIDGFWAARRGQPCSGLRAGLFHPGTGYSLPQAVRLADLIAGLPDLSAPALAAAIERHARQVWRSQTFFRALNRMLFLAALAPQRRQVMAHFYRLPDRLVGRFYGERLSPADMLRIVTGKPPVPISRALRAIFSGSPGMTTHRSGAR